MASLVCDITMTQWWHRTTRLGQYARYNSVSILDLYNNVYYYKDVDTHSGDKNYGKRGDDNDNDDDDLTTLIKS